MFTLREYAGESGDVQALYGQPLAVYSQCYTELELLLRFAAELPAGLPEISSENLMEAAQTQTEWREDEPVQGLSQQEALQNALHQASGFFLALDSTAEGEDP